jgi:hypothetical protein
MAAEMPTVKSLYALDADRNSPVLSWLAKYLRHVGVATATANQETLRGDEVPKVDKITGLESVGNLPIYLLPLVRPEAFNDGLFNLTNKECKKVRGYSATIFEYMTKIIGSPVLDNLVGVANGTCEFGEMPTGFSKKTWVKLTSFVGQMKDVDIKFEPLTVAILVFGWFDSTNRCSKGTFVEDMCQIHYSGVAGNCFVVPPSAVPIDDVVKMITVSKPKKPSKKASKNDPALRDKFEKKVKEYNEIMSGVTPREFDSIIVKAGKGIAEIIEAKSSVKDAPSGAKQLDLPVGTRIVMPIEDGDYMVMEVTPETKKTVFAGVDTTVSGMNKMPSVPKGTTAMAKGSFHLSTMLKYFGCLAEAGDSGPWDAFFSLVFEVPPKTVADNLREMFESVDELVVCKHTNCEKESVELIKFTTFEELEAFIETL